MRLALLQVKWLPLLVYFKIPGGVLQNIAEGFGFRTYFYPALNTKNPRHLTNNDKGTGVGIGLNQLNVDWLERGLKD